MFGAGFLLADAFLRMVANYRVVWLSGRFGGGKTSLAVWIAAWLVKNSYARRVVSNIPITGRVDPPPVPINDSVILLDESWMYVDSWNDVKAYAAFLRKANLYLLLPSVWAPHSRLRILECHRVFNGYVLSLPFWVYRWSLGMASISEKGYFALWMPHLVFGMYDTEYIPKDDGGIVDAIAASIGELPSGRSRSARQTASASSSESSLVEEYARRIDDAADTIERRLRYLNAVGRRR
ncbi:MAG: hypothetical protein CUN51_00735 [Candidatus Thermofonsia Clade 1 bacterium]|uniref:Zona occludens toxin N-terminal domain-containing protein n=1 Tax=Candidatus Thermofonsia Clade 1 bacterium TaxID=2364210 RepID=A0A2M8P3R1_9CHLR|nr:MAG: hypothetical protein CUN51_00735 [Candidatus Thermofonsia Clade 1 bacterium]